MRNGQDRCFHLRAGEEKDVDIDGPWTAAEGARAAQAAEAALNSLKRVEQLQRKKARLAFGHQVEEPGLRGYILRFRFIDGRALQNVNVFLLQLAERAFEILRAIAYIRSKRKINRFPFAQEILRKAGSVRRRNACAVESESIRRRGVWRCGHAACGPKSLAA